MNILGIESSCDETAVAIYSETQGLLAHQLYSQIDIHAPYGGVVPELASRDHIRKCMPLVVAALKEAKLNRHELTGIAYTRGPGLIGALLVGACLGRTLAWAWGLPALGIHHLEAHLLVAFLEPVAPQFPFIALLVSGGHTLLIHVKGFGNYEILGETLDDAVGEAFDKTAKLLGLTYPGGPALAKLAEHGKMDRFPFPRPMLHHPGFDFSFSGLKTYALNCLQKHQDPHDLSLNQDIAAGFQQAVIDTLWQKSLQALRSLGLNRLVVVGGVSANQRLRTHFSQELQKLGGEIFFPRPQFSTDNAAMVAYIGYLRLKSGQQDSALAITVDPRWSFQELTAF